MYRKSVPNDPEPGDPIRAPSQCPACGSRRLQTTSKIVTVASYWRCESCGEVWNAGRRRAGIRDGRR